MPLAVLSSAVVGDELSQARHLLNVRVSADYESSDPLADLRAMAQVLAIREPLTGC